MLRLLILFVCFANAAAAAPVRAVVSIAPLHAVVSAVADGVFEPELLISPAVSVHDHALKPSDALKIGSADVVFWGGERLEGALAKPVSQAKGRVFSAMTEREDPHFWLSPERMKKITRECAAFLAEADPDNARTYRSNADAFLKRIDALLAFGRRELAPFADAPFVVFHDAYEGFERDFALRGKKGAVRTDEHRESGAGHLIRLRAAMRDAGKVCLFSEPQMPSKRLSVLAEDLSVVFGTADPLGASVGVGKDFYDAMMKNLILSFRKCLSEVAQR